MEIHNFTCPNCGSVEAHLTDISNKTEYIECPQCKSLWERIFHFRLLSKYLGIMVRNQI